VDGVSVARGAIGNPWIFERARGLAAGVALPPPSLHRQREVIAEHYRMAEEIYGPARSCRVMRKFGIKYARLHPRMLEVRDAFVAVRRSADWRAVLERWYAEDLPGVGSRRRPWTDFTGEFCVHGGLSQFLRRVGATRLVELLKRSSRS